MAEAIVFVPKRKVAGFIGAGADALANMVEHVADSLSAPGTSPTGETVAYWHVTKEMKIPMGTDKFR